MHSTRSSTDSQNSWPGDRDILHHRGPRNELNPRRAYAAFVEPELTASGIIEDVATILITNRECPFRCLMCDLWKNTTEDTVPEGAICEQINHALQNLPPTRHIKLYNAGSFFDPGAIPPGEYDEIAKMLAEFETVIVEAHPRMVNDRCFDFADKLSGKLEVAIGLETIDPNVLPRLNKQMTLESFDEAINRLHDQHVQTRTFILIRTPFQSEPEGVNWAKASIQHAQALGISCCCIIPTRAGNGIMEQLEARGEFSPPSIESVEEVFAFGIEQNRGRIFLDLWDFQNTAKCDDCRDRRTARLARMNHHQIVESPIRCGNCQ